MDRTRRLNEEYGELRTDLLDEVNMVDERMIKPATEAREFLQPLKKIIKKRDDKKVRNEIPQHVASTKTNIYPRKMNHNGGSFHPVGPLNTKNLMSKNIMSLEICNCWNLC